MHCAKSKSSAEEIIKKSRFIGIVIPVESEQEIISNLRQVYQQHSTANHVAFAFRLLTKDGIIARLNDAGEPSGTAGKPIYQHLEGKDLINTLIVVVRYFGGVKLGAGGLTRAYGNAARNALETTKIGPYVKYQKLLVQLDYKDLQHFEYMLEKIGGRKIDEKFTDSVELLVSLPEDQIAELDAWHKTLK